MRDFAVGLVVSIFIVLFIIYTYQPSILDYWIRRLFLE
jgi:hypothetical protein